ncbi:MAG: HAD hydrolase-like protein [Candidatus Pacebacteria bacterium]|jgi:phosphoglycolate phosphatase-like HAD superfamily hydrolase|nr:HAD hydrolase-like protein [Candidatus Paceibacterota bacterium]
MKKLAVSDFNGTLLADARACMDADNHVLKTFGGKPVDLKTYRDTIIIPAINFYVQHGCRREELEIKSREVGEVLHTFYETRAAKCRTRRGAKQLLEWLRKNRIATVILSNHTVEGITGQLKRLGMDQLVTELLANHVRGNTLKNRNKKEKLRYYLEISGCNPKDAIIIGDSPEETEIGKELGICTVAITDGYYAKWRLKAARPDYLVRNLAEFREIINKS